MGAIYLYIRMIKMMNNNFFYNIKIEQKKKIIAHISFPQGNGMIGGVDTHILDILSNNNLSNNYNYLLIIWNENDDYLEIIKRKKINYIYLGKIKNNIKKLKSLLNFLKQYNISIIHSHQYQSDFLAVIIKFIYLLKNRKIKLIMTCHGWIKNTIKDKILYLLNIFAYFFSDIIIFVSKKEYYKFKQFKLLNNKYIQYMPNSVMLPKERKNYIKHFSKYRILYIGRLEEEKRVDLFIECAYLLHKKYSNLKFNIVGYGSEYKNLKKLVKNYNMENDIKFLKTVLNVKKVYMNNDIILLTSDTEGTPRVILEAMSYGLIPVCTNVGGIPDIIINNVNGFLAQKGDVDSIRKTIEHVLLLKDINTISTNARKTIINKFNSEKMILKLNAIYRKMVSYEKENINSITSFR